MVLCLKTWESRSSPGLPRTETSSLSMPSLYSRRRLAFDAGWSSPVARQAHNLKAAGSNPAPATNVYRKSPWRKKPGAFSLSRPTRRFFDGVLLDPQICPAESIRRQHFKLQPRDRIRSQFSLRMTTVQTGLTISRSPALAPSPSSRPG
jgi:hypothetical protein